MSLTLIPKGRDLDWKTIWNKQTLYPALADELLNLAYKTHIFLEEEAHGGLVRTIARTQQVWTDFKKYEYELSDRFIASLISIEETRADEAAARREHKFNAKIEAAVEIFKLGSQYWMKVYNDLNREQLLPYGELDFIRSMASYISKGMLPSDAQCKRLIKIVTKAEDKGYIMP